MRRRRHAVGVALLAGVIGVSSAFASGGSIQSFKVTSTLDGKKVLPLRSHWKATPHISASQVKKVEFLVDGHWLWTEHQTPYYYGGGGNEGNKANWLITSFLKPGRHTFTVKVFASGGSTASDNVHARVIQAPPPPSELAGTWKHTVDGKTITLSITTLGWGSPRDKFDARYEAGGKIVFGPLVVFPQMSPGARLGGFCNGIDPLHTWTYTAAADDQSFQLQPVGKDPCPDRQQGLQGTWTRVG